MLSLDKILDLRYTTSSARCGGCGADRLKGGKCDV